jgi:imidazolonepropionase-like amidohydrolase
MRKLLIFLLLTCSPCVRSEEIVAIRGARIIDGTGSAAVPGTVLIRGDRIVSVGAVEIPMGATVVDATGKTLLPGLFDLHTHMPYSAVLGMNGDWPKNLAAYLLSGVTTVVDFGTYPEAFAPMRELISSGRVQAPHLLLAARFTTPGGHGAEGGRGDIFSLEVLTPREARAAVRRVLPYKPDILKVFTDGWRYGAAPDMTSMDERTLWALVDEAHKNGLKVLTHTVTLERAKTAARAGVDVLAHGIGNAAADDELLGLLKASGTAYVSTLAVYEPRERAGLDALLERVLDPGAKTPLAASRRSSASEGDGGPASPRRARFATLQHNVAVLQRAGIPLGTGTDAGVTGTYHGWATLRELKLLVQAGLTPMEAIVAATRNSARAVALDKDRGTIEPGKRADLILVDGAPDRDIAEIDKIAGVFRDGRPMDLKALSKLIQSDGVSPLTSVPVGRDVDDFESRNGLSRLGTRWVNSTDTGTDHSRMQFGRILRKPGDHALAVMAEMSEKDAPLVRVVVPLRPGGVEPADVTRYKGIRFDARGDGEYALVAVSRSVRSGDVDRVLFDAEGNWRTVKVPFSKFAKWSGNDVLTFEFEIARPAGTKAWLELDDVRFY